MAWNHGLLTLGERAHHFGEKGKRVKKHRLFPLVVMGGTGQTEIVGFGATHFRACEMGRCVYHYHICHKRNHHRIGFGTVVRQYGGGTVQKKSNKNAHTHIHRYWT